MKTKRELQFLTYLDALEKGDAEGLSAFLALAEVDAELEKMMMDYHKEESPEENSKVITPTKRKRGELNRWWGRFGAGLVAAVVMVAVGAAGVMVGSSDSLYQTISTQEPQYFGNCQAEIASQDNHVVLIGGEGDIERSVSVGVNNPFVITLNTNRSTRSGGYVAIFEGLVVTISRNSLNLSGDCSATHNLTVYPQDDPAKTCSFVVDGLLTFPIEGYPIEANPSYGPIPYGHNIVVLDAPVDGNYPIIDPLIEGSILGEHVNASEGCSTFPMLYVQPYVPSSFQENNEDANIELSSLRLSEQHFEHGLMFYFEALGQFLIACDSGHVTNPSHAWLTIAAPMPLNLDAEPLSYPPDGFLAPQGAFISMWNIVTQGDCDLGWATGNSITTEKAPYSYANGVHTLTGNDGSRYAFDAPTTSGEFTWEIIEN